MTKRKLWSAQSRDRQRSNINKNKPWIQSCGPVTIEGKSRSAKNANKGKTPIRAMLKMVRQVHRERLELLRWIEGEYGIGIKL